MDEDQATILIRKRIFGPRLNFVGACARLPPWKFLSDSKVSARLTANNHRLNKVARKAITLLILLHSSF